MSEQLQDLVLDSADGIFHCSITLHRVHCAPTDAGGFPCAAALGELLGRHDEGPGKDALRTRTTRVIHDAASEDRWPECGDQLLDAGIR